MKQGRSSFLLPGCTSALLWFDWVKEIRLYQRFWPYDRGFYPRSHFAGRRFSQTLKLKMFHPVRNHFFAEWNLTEWNAHYNMKLEDFRLGGTAIIFDSVNIWLVLFITYTILTLGTDLQTDIRREGHINFRNSGKPRQENSNKWDKSNYTSRKIDCNPEKGYLTCKHVYVYWGNYTVRTSVGVPCSNCSKLFALVVRETQANKKV